MRSYTLLVFLYYLIYFIMSGVKIGKLWANENIVAFSVITTSSTLSWDKVQIIVLLTE